MKEYDLIIIGTGSAMNILEVMIQEKAQTKIAVIGKDEPGGICLTRGCIPKLLLYPAELVRIIENAKILGIDIEIRRVNFEAIMKRMRDIIYSDIDMIRRGLSSSKNMDYYPTMAEFTAPYTLKVGDKILTSKMILLCTGSKPTIPLIKGLEETCYHTSDTILRLNYLPRSIAIVGGSYITAEYGHFFSAMGSKVTTIGRNPQFLPEEEPEISTLAKRELGKNITIITNHEVREVTRTLLGSRKLTAYNRTTNERIEVTADEILIAVGRSPNTDILHPEKGRYQSR